MHNVMLDLETLGTVADSTILSIGAVKFDLETGTVHDIAFYASICVESNQQYKRRISADTLIWWFKQSPQAQQVMFEPKITLPQALEEFSDWCLEGTEQSKVTPWSNGADFDIAMLAHAFDTLQMELPWNFWNARCVRTYKTLPGADRVPYSTAAGAKHNALVDAMNQAQQVCAIHKALFKKAKVTA